MTDLQPGSRWLLPVTIDEIDDYAWAKTSVTENAAICIQTNDFPSLIPADRITELEAEVARLRKLADDLINYFEVYGDKMPEYMHGEPLKMITKSARKAIQG